MQPTSPQRIVVVGAGGHARVCIENLLGRHEFEVLGAVSQDGSGAPALGVPMLGTDDDVSYLTERAQATAFFVAIGDNRQRSAAAERWASSGLSLVNAVSAHAVLSHTAELDRGVAVMPGAVVNAATTIGRGAIVNTNASIDHDCDVGAFVHIAPGTAIGGGCAIGDGAFVGIGARITPGVTVGERAIVGAGAVVIRDVAPDDVVVGVPARRLGPER